MVETLKWLSSEDGIGLFVVEQKLTVATALATRILIMVNGQVALETTAAALRTDEDAQQRFLGVSPVEA
ncbi:MAG: hypothetical protein HC876_20110 [Chloroflexaceae bacterium]|nr:hypothetical protein [Chloroflexaceae bacterium]